MPSVKVRQPRKKQVIGRTASVKLPRRDGDTFTWVEHLGEPAPKCRACQQVVPLKLWLNHVCPTP